MQADVTVVTTYCVIASLHVYRPPLRSSLFSHKTMGIPISSVLNPRDSVKIPYAVAHRAVIILIFHRNTRPSVSTPASRSPHQAIRSPAPGWSPAWASAPDSKIERMIYNGPCAATAAAAELCRSSSFRSVMAPVRPGGSVQQRRTGHGSSPSQMRSVTRRRSDHVTRRSAMPRPPSDRVEEGFEIWSTEAERNDTKTAELMGVPQSTVSYWHRTYRWDERYLVLHPARCRAHGRGRAWPPCGRPPGGDPAPAPYRHRQEAGL